MNIRSIEIPLLVFEAFQKSEEFSAEIELLKSTRAEKPQTKKKTSVK